MSETALWEIVELLQHIASKLDPVPEDLPALSALDALAKALCDGDARCAYQWDEHSDAGHVRHRNQARAALRHLAGELDFKALEQSSFYTAGEAVAKIFGIPESEYADGAS